MNYNNPMQSRMDSLAQQKQMIEQQMNALSQYSVPPININNQVTPLPQNNFDFNGKWVDNEEQAKQFASIEKPLILFDNNNPIFYMKNTDGSLKKYTFTEVIEEPKPDVEKKVLALEEKMDMILNALQQPRQESPKEEPVVDKVEPKKENKR